MPQSFYPDPGATGWEEIFRTPNYLAPKIGDRCRDEILRTPNYRLPNITAAEAILRTPKFFAPRGSRPRCQNIRQTKRKNQNFPRFPVDSVDGVLYHASKMMKKETENVHSPRLDHRT